MKVCENNQPDEELITKASNHSSRCWLQHPDAPAVEGLYQPEVQNAG
jgi:hypothetical protein